MSKVDIKAAKIYINIHNITILSMVYDSLKLFQSNDNTYFRVENSISTAYLRAKLCISPEHNEMGVT